MSDEYSMLCAIRPAIPTDIITYNLNADVVIEWTAPDNNGSPITSYTIWIQTKDGQYA